MTRGRPQTGLMMNGADDFDDLKARVDADFEELAVLMSKQYEIYEQLRSAPTQPEQQRPVKITTRDWEVPMTYDFSEADRQMTLTSKGTA